MILEPLLLVIGLAASGIYGVASTWRRVVRSRHVVALLYDDQPQQFLEEIEKDIARCSQEVYRLCLLVNKSAGLYYIGRFEDAVTLLASLPWTRLPRTYQRVYWHNMLTSLLDLRRYDEARAVIRDHGHLLVAETRVKALNEALRGSRALYEMYCGDRRQGYDTLATLLKNATTDPGRAFRLFHLGVADLEDGRPDRAAQSMKMAATLAPNSFVPREAARLMPGAIR